MKTNCWLSDENYKQKKKKYQQTKLRVMNSYRDSLERRIAAVNASIEVLKEQINSNEVVLD